MPKFILTTLLLFLTTPSLLHAAEHRLLDPNTAWVCDDAQWARIQDLSQRNALYKASDQAAHQEWRQSKRLRQRINKGFGHYRRLRRLYLLRGLCNPATFIKHGLVLRRFQGRWILLHPLVHQALTRVEDRLKHQKLRKPGEVGGFQPRTIRGPVKKTDHLSNHAFGLALDLGAKKNPFLSPEELKLLEEISQTTLKLSTETTAGERWDAMHQAVKNLRANTPKWFKTNLQAIYDLQRLARHDKDPKIQQKLEVLQRKRSLLYKKHLRMLRRANGFNLTRPLVVAMEAEGLTWSTDFATGADLMHFEYRALW